MKKIRNPISFNENLLGSKYLTYSGKLYNNFMINKDGKITNLNTGNTYNISPNKNSGYIIASLPLGKRGKVKTIRVHKAVAESFIPEHETNKNIVHHKNGNKADPKLENLEWVSSSENKKYYIEEEIANNNINVNNRKLTSKDVINIKYRYINENISMIVLAKEYNVSKTTIYNIINNIYY